MLPSYMVPTLGVGIDTWPRTSSGKIDRKRLPKPTKSETQVDVHGQSAAIRIGNVAQKIIGKPINYSTPLMLAGCTSLGAVRLARGLSSELSRDLPATLIFDYPTINSIADFMANMGGLARTARIGMKAHTSHLICILART